MKKFFTLFAALCCIFLCSCNKNDDNANGSGTGYIKIDGITYPLKYAVGDISSTTDYYVLSDYRETASESDVDPSNYAAAEVVFDKTGHLQSINFGIKKGGVTLAGESDYNFYVSSYKRSDSQVSFGFQDLSVEVYRTDKTGKQTTETCSVSISYTGSFLQQEL